MWSAGGTGQSGKIGLGGGEVRGGAGVLHVHPGYYGD